MLRTITLTLLLAPAALRTAIAEEPTLVEAAPMCQLAPDDAAPTPAKDCCKICGNGKACGDTCIARSKTCRKPPGCACDG